MVLEIKKIINAQNVQKSFMENNSRKNHVNFTNNISFHNER
jgi:hypothetical protein